MRYLECCIKESLRLYPPVHFISRNISETVKLSMLWFHCYFAFFVVPIILNTREQTILVNVFLNTSKTLNIFFISFQVITPYQQELSVTYTFMICTVKKICSKTRWNLFPSDFYRKNASEDIPTHTYHSVQALEIAQVTLLGARFIIEYEFLSDFYNSRYRYSEEASKARTFFLLRLQVLSTFLDGRKIVEGVIFNILSPHLIPVCNS